MKEEKAQKGTRDYQGDKVSLNCSVSYTEYTKAVIARMLPCKKIIQWQSNSSSYVQYEVRIDEVRLD